MTPYFSKDTLTKSLALARLQQLDLRPFRKRRIRPYDPALEATFKALREKQALNCSALARRLGVSHCYISLVLSGRRAGKRIRPLIAAACGLRPEQIWPERKAS